MYAVLKTYVFKQKQTHTHTYRHNKPVLRPLYRSTCVSRHLQLRTGGFCWCKVLLPACHCWWQPAHLDWGEDAGVLLNSVAIYCLCTFKKQSAAEITVFAVTPVSWSVSGLGPTLPGYTVSSERQLYANKIYTIFNICKRKVYSNSSRSSKYKKWHRNCNRALRFVFTARCHMHARY